MTRQTPAPAGWAQRPTERRMAGTANRSDLENILGSLLQSVTKLTARSFTHLRVGSSFIWFLNGGGGCQVGRTFLLDPFWTILSRYRQSRCWTGVSTLQGGWESWIRKAPRSPRSSWSRCCWRSVRSREREIIAALNDTPDGHRIRGSEEQVRDAGHAFVKAAFETAVQQKVAAAEAAFLPSTGLPGQETRQSRSAEDPIFENPGIGSALVVDGGTPRPMAVWRVWMIT